MQDLLLGAQAYAFIGTGDLRAQGRQYAAFVRLLDMRQAEIGRQAAFQFVASGNTRFAAESAQAVAQLALDQFGEQVVLAREVAVERRPAHAGPLGQGIANAVGFALAEKIMAAQFNRDGHNIVDHNTYVFLGDGCMMEGISHEVCSLAGTLGLNKLIAFYDDNGISIDGEVHGWFTDDTPARFEAYGWQVIRNVDGHDAEEIKIAIETARKTIPSLKHGRRFGIADPKAGPEHLHLVRGSA